MAHTGKDIRELQHPVVLALETATLCGSVALITQDRCLAEFSLQTGVTHSRRLLAGIDRLLQETGVMLFPGTMFGDETTDYIRISYLQPLPMIQEAMERITKFAASARGGS